MSQYRRRQFLITAGMFLAAPLARAQASALPVIGYLSNGSLNPSGRVPAAFRRGLGEAGYEDGKNVVIEFRWASGQPDLLPGFAADLARRKVAVIVAAGGAVTWLPAKAATATIPIVFSGGGDPVKLGLVASFGRPGGNATGVTSNSVELSKKRLQLLRELVPAASVISVMVNVADDRNDYDRIKGSLEELQAIARTIGQHIEIVNARSERDFDAAFAEMIRKRAGALLVDPSGFLSTRTAQLVALAAKHALPACYPFSEYVDAGGLISYGDDTAERSRQVGVYVGKILKGMKPADLPVLQPTKYELVLNARTAKALGLKIPQSILASADRVVE